MLQRKAILLAGLAAAFVLGVADGVARAGDRAAGTDAAAAAMRAGSSFDPRLPAPDLEEEENTRSVRIIDEAPFPPAAPAAPAPVLATPGRPAAQTADIGAIDLKSDNTAGLSIQIVPGQYLDVGTKIAFKVTTKRPGYLLLVDVDATGKLTQIYPNQQSLLGARSRQATNRIRPGRTVTIPDPGDPLAGFEFVAAPPSGVAMVVAILSDKPVQLIDLPDVPRQLAGQQAALKYLTDFAGTLKIADNDTGALEDAKWSFDAKLYVIR